MSRKKRNQHSPTERIGKDRAAEKESKKDSKQEGGRNRCVFGWVSNKELGGAAITPLKAAAHALHRSSRQSAQPSRLLPSQSPRCILIDCNCQLTVCSSSGYCTLTFIIFLVLFQRLSWDQQFFLFHYKKKIQTAVLHFWPWENSVHTIWHPSSQCECRKRCILHWRLVEALNIVFPFLSDQWLRDLILKQQLVKEMDIFVGLF